MFTLGQGLIVLGFGLAFLSISGALFFVSRNPNPKTKMSQVEKEQRRRDDQIFEETDRFYGSPW